MTCIMMGKYYIKTDVNVKNGIFQFTSASRRLLSKQISSRWWHHSVYSVNVRGSFKLSTGGGAVLPPGAVMLQVTLYMVSKYWSVIMPKN